MYLSLLIIISVLLDDKLFLATLLDLPCILEAQKTLDYRTFFKSADVSQILYVHNKSLDEFQTRTVDEVYALARAFNPMASKESDPEFFANLYRRTELGKQTSDVIPEDWYKWRNGLAPSTKNVRNIRYKKE